MTSSSLTRPESVEVAREHPPPKVWRVVLASIEGRIAAVLGLPVLMLIAIGPFVAPYDPRKFLVAQPATGPSAAHLLGADADGKDVLSRLLTGGESVLLLPAAAVAISCALGGIMGIVSGYAGGHVDRVISRLFDTLLTLPPLLIVLVLLARLGSSASTVILTVGVIFAPGFGRVVRAATQATIGHAYVEAAKARGESAPSIIVREILPNIVVPVLAELGLRMTYGILFISSLSFLGLGVQPPSPDWGLMIAENRAIIGVNPLAALAPALAITLLAVSFNLLTDALSDYLARDEASRIIEV